MPPEELFGTAFGACLAGAFAGLIPFFVGRITKVKTEGNWSFVLCIAIGFKFGILGALPLALVLSAVIFFISRLPKETQEKLSKMNARSMVGLSRKVNLPKPHTFLVAETNQKLPDSYSNAANPPSTQVSDIPSGNSFRPKISPEVSPMPAALPGMENTYRCRACNAEITGYDDRLPPWCSSCGADLI